VVLHDCRKPQTRTPQPDAGVSFPGHEAMAAREVVPQLVQTLELSADEASCLTFLVAKHGDAHSWKVLSRREQNELSTSAWKESMALLQAADAKSCLLPGGKHLRIFWNELSGQGN
jgi:hypothetical protein